MANPDSTDNAVRWEHFPHEADIGVRGIGPDLSTAFEQAAVALTAVICDPDVVKPLKSRAFECAAPDYEMLLVDWLNALVYSMATEHMLFSEFEVRVTGTRLHALARGEELNLARHRPAVEIKGATLTELSVQEREDGSWLAQCVVDV